MLRSYILFAASALLLACAPSGRAQTRSQLEQSLVSGVIIQTIDGLPDSADSAYLATSRAPTPDSARALFRSMWASWWHNAQQNGVVLSPTLLGRFAEHFDIESPPADPYPDVPSWYEVRELRTGKDSLTADIGPPYAGCKYSFTRRGAEWVLTGTATDCWIS
jgi:hypothetical protein